MPKKLPESKQRGKQESAGSQVQLARALGSRGLPRSNMAISTLMRSNGWAAAELPRSFPMDKPAIDRVEEYVRGLARRDGRDGYSATGEEGGGGKVAKATGVAKLKLLVSRRKLLDFQRSVEEQQYLDREEAEADKARQNDAIKRALMQVPRALRQILGDTADPGKCEAILTEALQRVCNEGFDGSGSTT